jgi:hypothetical protein
MMSSIKTKRSLESCRKAPTIAKTIFIVAITLSGIFSGVSTTVQAVPSSSSSLSSSSSSSSLSSFQNRDSHINPPQHQHSPPAAAAAAASSSSIHSSPSRTDMDQIIRTTDIVQESGWGNKNQDHRELISFWSLLFLSTFP